MSAVAKSKKQAKETKPEAEGSDNSGDEAVEMQEGEEKEEKTTSTSSSKKRKAEDGAAFIPRSAEVDKGAAGDLAYDLGNLEAYEARHLDAATLGNDMDGFITALARDNTQLLINRLFSLQPQEPGPNGVGRLVTLPKPIASVPREKPVPKGKVLTKWQAFAAEKGIVKKKKSRLVYDEMKEEYLPRYGYKKANDATQEWAIDHKEGEDAKVDPWTRMATEKKERVAKNKKNQLGNIKAAMGARAPGQIDLTSTHERKQGKRNQEGKGKKDRSHVDVALGITQRSTASMGVHDVVRDAEPVLKPERVSRSGEGELARSVDAEKKQSLSVLSAILGRETKEKDNTFAPEKALHASETAKAKESRPGRKKGQGKGLK